MNIKENKWKEYEHNDNSANNKNSSKDVGD